MSKTADKPSVLDVAEFILRERGPMSAMKLQKLCYYSQAWHLAWTDKPLFDDEIQAWANGPVIPNLFFKHQGEFQVEPGGLADAAAGRLSDKQREYVKVVLEFYGDKSPQWLSDLTHFEDPWKKARGNTPLGEMSSATITHRAMHNYYAAL